MDKEPRRIRPGPDVPPADPAEGVESLGHSAEVIELIDLTETPEGYEEIEPTDGPRAEEGIEIGVEDWDGYPGVLRGVREVTVGPPVGSRGRGRLSRYLGAAAFGAGGLLLIRVLRRRSG